ncbi:STAS domain-containing protein [Nocardia sp. AG03]|uniref:STAS domain-containing protein n=1 Tax=Nocardia sp. AG03 TaxID=3025312 RepID=UPI00241820F8|nr:STAS domain-containing protein [Nocardia sp. AG03]
MAVVTRRRHGALRWYRGTTRTSMVQRLRRRGELGCWVMFAGPELDAAHAPGLRALLERSLRSGAKAMVLDLRGTEFLSIRVAASLVAAKREAARHDIDLRLVTGRPEVDRALDLVGVRPLFRYYTSIEAASASTR